MRNPIVRGKGVRQEKRTVELTDLTIILIWPDGQGPQAVSCIDFELYRLSHGMGVIKVPVPVHSADGTRAWRGTVQWALLC